MITDGRRGDRICAGRDGRGCGAVLQDHIEVQGADRRNFEGEDVSCMVFMYVITSVC